MSSTFSAVLLLLLLCHSMHACEARRLGRGGTWRERSNKHHSIKDVKKAITEKTLNSHKANPTLSVEVIPMPNERVLTDENHVAVTATRKLVKNPDQKGTAAAMLNEVTSSHGTRGQITTKNSGNEIVMFSDVGFQQSTKIEEMERRGRSVLGSESHFSEETIEPKKNEVGEDVVVMDYEQPRRKPPIHNFSP